MQQQTKITRRKSDFLVLGKGKWHHLKGTTLFVNFKIKLHPKKIVQRKKQESKVFLTLNIATSKFSNLIGYQQGLF